MSHDTAINMDTTASPTTRRRAVSALPSEADRRNLRVDLNRPRDRSPNQPTLHSTRPTREVMVTPADAIPLQPLRETETTDTEPVPPTAGPEIDDLDPENGVDQGVPQPGVDDGFFPHDDSPGVGDGLLPGGKELPAGHNPDPTDNPTSPNPKSPGIFPNGGPPWGGYPEFPYAPEFGGPDLAVPRVIPDVNVYQHKKTLAQGMMDLALLSANANQLRYVLESFSRHPYYYPSLVFISMSLILQVAVGVGLIWNSRYNVKNQDDICKADKINNFTIIGIFMITIVNVFISSFGVANSN